MPEIASTARNHRRSAASHRHRQHWLWGWRHPCGGEGGARRASATMAATLGDTVASSGIWAISLEGQGEAKCAGRQGTWWEGSGRQLGSKPLGAEAWERAHWPFPVLHTWPGKKVTEFSMSGLETKIESMIDVVWCNVTRQYRVNVLICSNDCPVECLLILLSVSIWQDGEFQGTR